MKEFEIAFLAVVTVMSLLMNYVWSTSSWLNLTIKLTHLFVALSAAFLLLNKLGVAFVVK
jgi:hypothetical protein